MRENRANGEGLYAARLERGHSGDIIARVGGKVTFVRGLPSSAAPGDVVVISIDIDASRGDSGRFLRARFCGAAVKAPAYARTSELMHIRRTSGPNDVLEWERYITAAAAAVYAKKAAAAVERERLHEEERARVLEEQSRDHARVVAAIHQEMAAAGFTYFPPEWGEIPNTGDAARDAAINRFNKMFSEFLMGRR